MRKKRAIRNFAGIIFLCLVVLIFTVISFQVPNSDYTFVGFARGINLGIQYQGGAVLTYDASSNNTASNLSGSGLDSRSVYITNLLYSKFNYSANVYKTSNSSIKLEVAYAGNYTEGDENIEEYISNILNLSNKLTITTKAIDDTNETDDEIVPLTGQDLTNVDALEYNGTFGININFTDAGRQKLADLTANAGSNEETIYFYIGDYTDPFTQFTVSEKLDQSSIFISGSMSSIEEAKVMADQINSTKYDYSFSNSSFTTISKSDANANLIKSVILAVVVFLAVAIYLYVRYKKLGLCGVLAIFIAILVQILLLLSLPNVTLSSTGFIVSVLSIMFGGVICEILFSRMGKEYAVGKKIHASVKFGFTKTFVLILDIMAMLGVIMLSLLILGSSAVHQVAIAGIVGLLVQGLSCLLLTYLFAKMYVDICPSKAKNYGFKREAHIDELK